MEKEKFKQIIGIIIIIALAGSLFAVGQWNIEDNSNPDIPSVEPTKSFNYTISFDTNVIKELNSIRIAIGTSSLDKQKVDLAVKNLDSVARISNSQFRANKDDWIYFAEIDLKRTADIQKSIESIISLNHFEGNKQVMKKVTISTPNKAIDVQNKDLNITRKFTFSYPTTFAIADLSTQPGDEINVTGTIKLQGNKITSIELLENLTPKQVTFEKTLELIDKSEEILFNAKGDIDKNSLKDSVKAIDKNAMIYVSGTNIFGKSSLEHKEEIENVLLDKNLQEINFNQQGNFYLEKAFVEDLNKEIIYNNEVVAEVPLNAEVGKEIPLSITLSVLKDEVKFISAKIVE